MNWEDVYERMKVMLDALGVDWKHKAKVMVSINGDDLCFECNGDRFSFRVNQPVEGNEEL